MLLPAFCAALGTSLDAASCEQESFGQASSYRRACCQAWRLLTASPRRGSDRRFMVERAAAGRGSNDKGHVLVEPYFYDLHTVGRFDEKGRRRSAAHDDSFGSLSYLLLRRIRHVHGGPNSPFRRTQLAGRIDKLELEGR